MLPPLWMPQSICCSMLYSCFMLYNIRHHCGRDSICCFMSCSCFMLYSCRHCGCHSVFVAACCAVASKFHNNLMQWLRVDLKKFLGLAMPNRPVSIPILYRYWYRYQYYGYRYRLVSISIQPIFVYSSNKYH